MLIFKNNLYYVYIHIPKNGGKYIRKKIMDNNKNEILRAYWCTENNFDLAHIPYVKRNEYVEPTINYHYFTYSRNPYHRLISGYFYLVELNRFANSIQEFIHFYPQYLFLCDETYQIPNTIKIIKLEKNENPTFYNLIEYYDNECIQIVNQVYKKDFELLKYPTVNKVFPFLNKLKLLL